MVHLRHNRSVNNTGAAQSSCLSLAVLYTARSHRQLYMSSSSTVLCVRTWRAAAAQQLCYRIIAVADSLYCLSFRRDADGRPSCIRDECAHRACPLSLGEVVDGKVSTPVLVTLSSHRLVLLKHSSSAAAASRPCCKSHLFSHHQLSTFASQACLADLCLGAVVVLCCVLSAGVLRLPWLAV